MTKTKLYYLNYLKQNILKHYIISLTFNLAFPKMRPSNNIMKKIPQLSNAFFKKIFFFLLHLFFLLQPYISILTGTTIIPNIDSSCLLNLILAFSEPSSSLSPENTDLYLSFLCLQTFIGSLSYPGSEFLSAA
uniref:Uncharacterized protein n=1 Tax=Rousettus aegyptiacus TaxID=9407 RepID=A0A7J8D699_ROUAE|nr:hypothetical protein HJG63_008729 [Rousettus aegyptiacus]